MARRDGRGASADGAAGRGRRRRETVLIVGLMGLVAIPAALYLGWELGGQGELGLRRPWALLLAAALPLAYWVRLVLRRRRQAAMAHSAGALLGRQRRGIVARLAHLPGVLRVVALALLVVALAGPTAEVRGAHVEVEGIDIALALDLSNSMEASDLRPNRLEAAKRVVDDFISRRRSDKIGLIVFGREAFTYCPLTLDYSVLRTMLSEIHLGLIDGQATAIGNALGVSLARLRTSDAESRVVILLTDGDNNSGNVTPAQAARYASAMGVKVFTILMGPKEGEVQAGRDVLGRPIRVRRQYPVNPELLQKIAQRTGGRAYRATDRQALEQNFESILDELDKSTRRDVAATHDEAFQPFVAVALVLLGLELLLVVTRMRQFP